MYCHTNWIQSRDKQSNRVSANPGNVVLARPRTFVGCVLLLPSIVKTLLAGMHILVFSGNIQATPRILYLSLNN